MSLPIEAHRNSDGAVRTAFIVYKPNNFVTDTLKAEEMVTVTFFGSDGSKVQPENNQVYLTNPVTLAFEAISSQDFKVDQALCAYYDLQRKMWSTEGCSLDWKLKGETFF